MCCTAQQARVLRQWNVLGLNDDQVVFSSITLISRYHNYQYNGHPTSINLYTTTFGEIGLEYTIVGCPVLCQATINIGFLTVIVHEDAFELMEGPKSVMTHVKCMVEIVTDYNRELGIQGREVKPDSVWA